MKKILFLTLIVSLKTMACIGGSLRLNDDSTLFHNQIRFDVDPASSIKIDQLIEKMEFTSKKYPLTDKNNEPTHIVKFLGYVRGPKEKYVNGQRIFIPGKGDIISTTYFVQKVIDINSQDKAQSGIVKLSSNEFEDGSTAKSVGLENPVSIFDNHDFKAKPILDVGCN
jgi:hypothetical protein